MKIVSQFDFQWSPFYENIGILGQQGEGKTTQAREILLEVPNIPRFVWSPQRPKDHFNGYGDFVNNIEEIQKFTVWTGDFGKKTFLKICDKIFKTMTDIVFVVDDVHEQCTKQMIAPEFEHLILSGRNRGISGIYISPYPNRIHNSILGSCQHLFSFRFDLQAQVEWMAQNFFGNDAWILLAKDKRRRGCFDSDADVDLLPRHSILYRKNTQTETQLMTDAAPVAEQSLNLKSEEEEHE